MSYNLAEKKEIHPDIAAAIEVLQIEAEAVSNLISKIDDEFLKAVELLYNCSGRVVVSGDPNVSFLEKFPD